MKFLSDNTVKLLFVLLIFIYVAGPTSFINKMFVNSLGVMVNNMTSMATFTDPLVNGGFSEAEISGKFSIIDSIMSGDEYRGVFGILDTLPLGTVTAVIYTVCVCGFICTTLDAASLCLASTTTNSLDEENNQDNRLRLFRCLMLTLVPLAIMFSGASFDAIKQMAILISIPLAVVLVAFAVGFLGWLRADRKVPGMLLFVPDEMEEMLKIGRHENVHRDMLFKP